MTTEDPNDDELFDFVLKLSGWQQTGLATDMLDRPFTESPPAFLSDLNMWNAYVWPAIQKLGSRAICHWYEYLAIVCGTGEGYAAIANAGARQRCLALWRMLGGKLPERVEAK